MVETTISEEAARNNPPKAGLTFYSENGERMGCAGQDIKWHAPGSH